MPDKPAPPAPEVTAKPAVAAQEPTPAQTPAVDDGDAVYDWTRHLPGAAPDEESTPVSLPTHKEDLVAVAIDRGIPSYEAWAMTVPQLTKTLEG